MLRISVTLFIAHWLFACTASAGPFGRRYAAPPSQNTAGVSYRFGTAAEVAQHMARICRIGHFGGNSGPEGVGCGSTPQAAEMNCCFRSRWQPKDVGIAQGSNGLWYACCRY
jgi:hypothetical protein